MSHITVDRTACEGYGNCVLAAANYFDLDDDEVVVTLQTSVASGDLNLVRQAAVSCPVNAIRIEED